MKGFDELEADVIETDLCTRCGTCIGVCPVQTLAYVDGKIADTENRCIQCGMCSAVCPGKDFPMDKWSSQIFQKNYDVKMLFGRYESIWNVHSNDKENRHNSSSGGAITQILLDMLEMHLIEGVVAVRKKDNVPYEFESFIAVNKEQIIASAQSKYIILPVNQVIRDIRRSGKKIAYVGLPCQIQGMRKAMEKNAWLSEQIVVFISLFCGFNMEYEATDYLISKSGIRKAEIEELSYRHKKGNDTGFYIKGKDGKDFFVSKHGYTFLNLIFSPMRCWQCFDYSGEFADISVGDAWEKGQGFSRVIIRTEAGSRIFETVRKRGTIYAEPCDETAIIKTQNNVITYKKKQIAMRKDKMKHFPDYGVEFEKCGGKIQIKGMILYSMLLVFKKPIGRWIIPILPYKLLVKISAGLKGREVK